MSDELENEMPTRKKNRLENFDYSSCGAYFVTICTEGRRPILSRIVGGGVLDAPISVELCIYGQVADRYIRQMNDFYHDIQVKRYVIMPNHIHLLIVVSDSGASGTPPPTKQNATIARFVSTFKRFCNKEYGGNIWQRNYYDHIIRNRKDYEDHVKYIYENPIHWAKDDMYIEE